MLQADCPMEHRRAADLLHLLVQLLAMQTSSAGPAESRSAEAACLYRLQSPTHPLITVLAAHHGKDVYVEKPASHNIWEGRQMVAAARKVRRHDCSTFT